MAVLEVPSFDRIYSLILEFKRPYSFVNARSRSRALSSN